MTCSACGFWLITQASRNLIMEDFESLVNQPDAWNSVGITTELQFLCRMEEEEPYEPDDWLGPYRGLIKSKVAAGPAGRAYVLACGFPPAEIPASPRA